MCVLAMSSVKGEGVSGAAEKKRNRAPLPTIAHAYAGESE